MNEHGYTIFKEDDDVDTQVQSTVIKNRFNKRVSCYNATNILHITLSHR
jgi:hypothetical protein